ncbi:MAG: phage portal protein [Chloroflexota bacterium]|nr:phage portal protein [Chloroflexota bacterium]
MTSSAQTLAFPQQLIRLDLGRLKAYRDNLDFYQGTQWAEPARRRERRLTFNYAKTLIDKTAAYVMSGLGLAVDPVDGSPQAAEAARHAEAALREASEANNLEQLDFDTEIDCSILGDAAFKVTWDPLERRVRVAAPDVQGLFVWWLGDDVSRVWRVASRYQLSADEVQMLYGIQPSATRRGAPRGRSQSTVVEVWTDRDFELWLDDVLVESKANPYGFIPFVIFPNLREPKKFWGVSDIPAICESVRELNRAMSQLSMILELSGNPIAVLENVTEAQDIAVQPGAVWELPEKARAYLLDLLQGGGVRLHTDYIDLVYRTLHDLGESPRTAFGENRQGLSGVALQMELDPLLKKVQRKQLIRAAAYKRRNEMILRILEQHTGVSYAPYRTRVIWGPLLPQDRSRLVDDEARLVAAGIHSRRRAADELGVEDPETEFERWLAEEGQAGGGNAEGGMNDK